MVWTAASVSQGASKGGGGVRVRVQTPTNRYVRQMVALSNKCIKTKLKAGVSGHLMAVRACISPGHPAKYKASGRNDRQARGSLLREDERDLGFTPRAGSRAPYIDLTPAAMLGGGARRGLLLLARPERRRNDAGCRQRDYHRRVARWGGYLRCRGNSGRTPPGTASVPTWSQWLRVVLATTA